MMIGESPESKASSNSMRRLLPILLFASAAFGHDTITTKLTWSRDISRIIWKRCGSCHRDGGSAPMALLSYEDARPWAKAIKEEVLERRMPPWGGVKGFGDFRNDWSLTQEEISVIADWVEGGAPAGDPNLLPYGRPADLPAALPGEIFGKVRSELKIEKTYVLRALRPEGDVPEAQVTAILPDGQIEPVLWLRSYRAKWKHPFVLRRPLTLPAGSIIHVDPPASLALYR